MITGGDLRQSRLDVGYKTFTISPWSSPISQFMIVLTIVSSFMAAIFMIAYSQIPSLAPDNMHTITGGMFKAFVMLLIPVGIISGLFVLLIFLSKQLRKPSF